MGGWSTPSLHSTDRGRPAPSRRSTSAQSPSTSQGRSPTFAKSTRGFTGKSSWSPRRRKKDRTERLTKRNRSFFQGSADKLEGKLASGGLAADVIRNCR